MGNMDAQNISMCHETVCNKTSSKFKLTVHGVRNTVISYLYLDRIVHL